MGTKSIHYLSPLIVPPQSLLCSELYPPLFLTCALYVFPNLSKSNLTVLRMQRSVAYIFASHCTTQGIVHGFFYPSHPANYKSIRSLCYCFNFMFKKGHYIIVTIKLLNNESFWMFTKLMVNSRRNQA